MDAQLLLLVIPLLIMLAVLAFSIAVGESGLFNETCFRRLRAGLDGRRPVSRAQLDTPPLETARK